MGKYDIKDYGWVAVVTAVSVATCRIADALVGPIICASYVGGGLSVGAGVQGVINAREVLLKSSAGSSFAQWYLNYTQSNNSISGYSGGYGSRRMCKY